MAVSPRGGIVDETENRTRTSGVGQDDGNRTAVTGHAGTVTVHRGTGGVRVRARAGSESESRFAVDAALGVVVVRVTVAGDKSRDRNAAGRVRRPCPPPPRTPQQPYAPHESGPSRVRAPPGTRLWPRIVCPSSSVGWVHDVTLSITPSDEWSSPCVETKRTRQKCMLTTHA